MKINLVSFGCKVNISENDSFALELEQLGYIIIPSVSDADIIIINTCAVTEVAANKCKSFINKTKKNNPNIKIITTGCMISDEMAKIDNLPIDRAIQNADKDELTKLIMKDFPIDTLHYSCDNTKLHTRAFLKIQDGCDAFCSYCIIPKLRGKPTSIAIDNVISSFNKLVASGYKEIVIVGIHIGLYGKGENFNLYELLDTLSKIDGDFRIRLSSLEVNELDDKLIHLITSSEKICNYVHIPLQSGCNKTLQAMNRRYDKDDYINTINKLRSIAPDITIGSDIIVGFPDETDSDFQETRQTLQSAGTEFFHVFPYSIRYGTVAETMPNHIDKHIKDERANILRNDANNSMATLMQRAIGKTYRILTEKGNKGHAENYLLIHVNEPIPTNTFVNVIVTEIKDNKLFGNLINNERIQL